MKKIDQRKVMLINKDFQIRFMAYMLMGSLIPMGVYFLADFYMYNSFIIQGQSLGLPQNHVFFRLIKDHHDQLNQVFFVASGIVLICMAIFALLFSHRIAGPIYNLCKFLNQHSPKDAVELKFRPNDFFKEIPSAVNNFLKK